MEEGIALVLKRDLRAGMNSHEQMTFTEERGAWKELETHHQMDSYTTVHCSPA